THKRGFLIDTFSYFDEERNHLSYYSHARFRIVRARLWMSTWGTRRVMNPLRRVFVAPFEYLANLSRAWQYRCERWWGHLVGFEEAEVELVALKDGYRWDFPATTAKEYVDDNQSEESRERL